MVCTMSLRTKRWNEPAEPDDGYRLLITRYRPRGVPREREPWSAWCNALAPSTELHAAAYGKTGSPPIPFSEYERRFLEEMAHQRFWIESFAHRLAKGETLTLLCSSACIDETRCHRTLVKRLLEEASFPPALDVAPTGPRVVRRKRQTTR